MFSHDYFDNLDNVFFDFISYLPLSVIITHLEVTMRNTFSLMGRASVPYGWIKLKAEYHILTH